MEEASVMLNLFSFSYELPALASLQLPLRRVVQGPQSALEGILWRMPSLNLLRRFVRNDQPLHDQTATTQSCPQPAQVSHANFSVFATWPPGHTGYSCGQDAGTGVGALIAHVFFKPRLLHLQGSSFGADGESGLCVAGTAGM